MWPQLVPVVATAFAWWSTTGLILFLNRLDRRSFPVSLAGAGALLVLGLFLLHATATDATPGGALLGAAGALLVWGWLELSFLTGFLTGPRQSALPFGCSGIARFGEAVRAILWHELAILALALVIILLTRDATNPAGLLVFAVLWAMRLSAKLNLFLGVPNVGAEYLPSHIAYLASYFRRRPMNLLFPVSVTAGTWVTVWLARLSVATPGEGLAAAYAIAATLCGLAVLEHWFMVLPLRSEWLWRWSLGETRTVPVRVAGAATRHGPEDVA